MDHETQPLHIPRRARTPGRPGRARPVRRRQDGRQGEVVGGPQRGDRQGPHGGAVHRGRAAAGRLLLQYTPEGAKRMTGAPVELDKKLGGVIASLRERGEFVGDEGEMLLLIPPRDSIKARALLLVGLGEEDALSLKVLERVGKVSLREAARLGVSRVAFAPLIRDQGNSKLAAGDVETAAVRGVLLAYATAKRLQKEGLARKFTLEQWNVEAGPDFFDDTVAGVEKGIEEAKTAAGKRSTEPYASGKK